MSLRTTISHPPPVVKAPPAHTANLLPEVSAHQTPAKAKPPAEVMIRDERFPGPLVSALIHAALLLALALLSAVETKPQRLTISARIDHEPPASIELIQQQDPPLMEIEPNDAVPNQEILSKLQVVEFNQPEMLPSAPGRQSSQALVELIEGFNRPSKSSTVRLPGNAAIDGRTDAMRQELADKYGASPASEVAVDNALDWLAAHQQNNGSWDFDLSKAPCNGQCRNPRNNPDGQATPKTAATGLALLPFLGAGHSHLRGKHAETVSRGIYYLRGQMRDAAQGRELMHGSMYGHGIATLAIAEAYAMTKDEGLYEMLLDLQKFTMTAQHEKGGWRYNPGQPGDMTVTGWQILALKSCEIGGLAFPTSVHARAEDFVNRLSSEQGSRFGYLESGAEPTPTAVGLLLQMYLGKPPGDAAVLEGCHYLYELGPSKTNVYFNYYATMTLHHARYYDFPKWNLKMRDHLVKTQASRGHEAGSWHFADRFGAVGGRLYSTAMCALVLETYYRYLPLWEEAEFPL